MSIAWATIALLVLLLPGFTFIARLYSVERTARHSSASPLAFLAGALPAAFFIQMVLYLAFHRMINLRILLAVLQLQGAENVSLAEMAASLEASRLYILGYVVLSGALGWSAGWIISAFVRSGWFPIFVRHGHVRHLLIGRQTVLRILYRESIGRLLSSALKDPPLTRAYVVTKIQHTAHVVMYDGFLREFYFTDEGRIAYLVLDDCYRCYLDLAREKSPETSIKDKQAVGVPHDEDDRPPELLMIDGSDIANVYFEKGGIRKSAPQQEPSVAAEIEKDTAEMKSLVEELVRLTARARNSS